MCESHYSFFWLTLLLLLHYTNTVGKSICVVTMIIVDIYHLHHAFCVLMVFQNAIECKFRCTILLQKSYCIFLLFPIHNMIGSKEQCHLSTCIYGLLFFFTWSNWWWDFHTIGSKGIMTDYYYIYICTCLLGSMLFE